MVGLILDLGAVIICPHGGRVSPVTVNSRVLLNGMPALLVSDRFPIADCPFETPIPDGVKPQPCTESGGARPQPGCSSTAGRCWWPRARANA
jgi:hypothetical protein